MTTPKQAAANAVSSCDDDTKRIVNALNFDVFGNLDLARLGKSLIAANIEWAQREVVPQLSGPLSGLISAGLAALKSALT
jgi:hypothetical protein